MPTRIKNPDARLSRRRIIRTAPIAVGLLGTVALEGQTPVRPDISQTFETVLDSDEVFSFVADPGKPSLDGPVPAIAGYLLTGDKISIPKAAEIPLTAAVVETYRISQNGKLVATVDVTVPVKETVSLTILNHLFIRTTVPEPAKTAILTAFRDYDWGNTPDPNAYADAKMAAAGVTRDMFSVRQSYHIAKKAGARQLFTQERNALRTLYGQNVAPEQPLSDSRNRTWRDSTLDLSSNDRKLVQEIPQQGYKLDLVNTKSVGKIPNKPLDAMHQMVGKIGDTPNVLDIINAELKGLDCQMGKPIQKRIATVFAYPEFMVRWELVTIQIGCVRVLLTLPFLHIRLSAIVLWAYVGNPPNILPYVIAQLEGCAVKAVLTGALIGVVLSNFAAALATFRVVFVDCVSAIPANTARCLAPGLVLLTEPDGDWKRLY